MNLLLGLDGSELSMRALDHSVERARETDGTLTVAIYEGPTAVDLDDLESRAVERLNAAGLEVDVRRLREAPGSRLVELAEHDYDQLVLGGGRISPMGKIRLGDVLEFVLANVQITVTLVR